jgi:uncharacterized protein involved in type VI secretion and phage assembly
LAGAIRGSFFMPEIDDEVLVAFEAGDLPRPFPAELVRRAA